MNKQTISLSKTRVNRILTLALPIGVLLLSQACAPPPSRSSVEATKSNFVAASEMASSVENHNFNK
ncbi:hypothetical protein NIES2119_25180 [[Phormidium ambiguum] IAM M-71]|uniref:Uncharacterized protein n=1 Tax=[Phormidium ambiguum] IAM M-71 TaxID=454136 RepID=A0A1U7I8I4_9CYAN|nr:hypothetical protein [Phormidium ambiguum]OKH32722.1 hypothetical protein NIES2119_25180 [Phormidium ambiguum IAM M-71]